MNVFGASSGVSQGQPGVSRRLTVHLLRLREGVNRLREGVNRSREGVNRLRNGVNRLRNGETCSRDSAWHLRDKNKKILTRTGLEKVFQNKIRYGFDFRKRFS